MLVDEDKYISRRLDVALKVLAAVVFVVFAVGAAIRFSSHGPTDIGAWGLCLDRPESLVNPHFQQGAARDAGWLPCHVRRLTTRSSGQINRFAIDAAA
jgi:hypothetical protein